MKNTSVPFCCIYSARLANGHAGSEVEKYPGTIHFRLILEVAQNCSEALAFDQKVTALQRPEPIETLMALKMIRVNFSNHGCALIVA